MMPFLKELLHGTMLLWGLAFAATLVLCAGRFFREPLRRRRRLPFEADEPVQPPRPLRREIKRGMWQWMGLLAAIPAALLFVWIIAPTILAMALLGALRDYRYHCRIIYRALRRHGHVLAFPLCWFSGPYYWLRRCLPRASTR